MRPTVTITVLGCLAEMTTPTFVLRRNRRHPVACSPAGVAVCATVAAVRLRPVTALRAATPAAGALPPPVFPAPPALALPAHPPLPPPPPPPPSLPSPL